MRSESAHVGDSLSAGLSQRMGCVHGFDGLGWRVHGNGTGVSFMAISCMRLYEIRSWIINMVWHLLWLMSMCAAGFMVSIALFIELYAEYSFKIHVYVI